MRLTDEELQAMATELVFGKDGVTTWWCEVCINKARSGAVSFKELHNSDDRCPDCSFIREEPHDFINDANASRQLVLWLIENGTTAELCDFDNFMEYWDGGDVFSKLYALALPPRTITIAVLYASGRVSIDEAKEAVKNYD